MITTKEIWVCFFLLEIAQKKSSKLSLGEYWHWRQNTNEGQRGKTCQRIYIPDNGFNPCRIFQFFNQHGCCFSHVRGNVTAEMETYRRDIHRCRVTHACISYSCALTNERVGRSYSISPYLEEASFTLLHRVSRQTKASRANCAKIHLTFSQNASWLKEESIAPVT